MYADHVRFHSCRPYIRASTDALIMSSKRQNKLLNYFDVTTPRQSTEESTTSTAEGDVGLEHSSVLTESDSESEGEDTTPSAASETPTCECMCCSDRNNAH